MPNYKRKATNRPLTADYLDAREAKCHEAGYPTPKWIAFARIMLRYGLEARLYEARQTVSKYITVAKGGRSFKVRFSNHKPIREREANGDCDFFVGHTNFGITSTDGAIKAVLQHFNESPLNA